MKLSVIIVNYNVKHFLEQCLISVLRAARHCETEIFVVDNDSVDGSCLMVKEKFPTIKLIENKKNYGFSYANNQAIRQSIGEYILLLNPDTIIEEKTLKLITDFMDNMPDAGALGVKMIDGKGKFLPESKRGLPTPDVAFYKIFGLSKIFPKSKKFGQYHLTYLDNSEINKVSVLSGACMLVRKSVLDKIGLLDETFFMYGEDIDLSYRITLAGNNNYYFPDTTIIHYKGESTKKASANYVIVFYKAMIIFAKKHFTSQRVRLFSFLINLAIYLVATLSILYRFAKKIVTPIIDFIIIFSGLLIITNIYEHYALGFQFKLEKIILLYIIYSLIWILSFIFSGAYDKPLKISNLFKGIGFGTLFVLIFFALLPADLRFSRFIIFLATTWNLLLIPLIRFLLHFTGRNTFKVVLPSEKRVAIVGQKEECLNLVKILNNNNPKIKVTAFVNPLLDEDNNFFIGSFDKLEEIVSINKIDEIIFSINNFSTQQIINTMLNLQNKNIDYKIASADGFSVIGSNSINRSGELYNININSITNTENKRKKRTLDFITSLIFILFFPILVFFVKNKYKMLINLFSVLIAKKTFVGYSVDKNENVFLPKIKKGIFSPLNLYNNEKITSDIEQHINVLYAKDYKILTDITIIWKSWQMIGKY
ncbi:MAG: glycosyltransferase [Bacteroidales bacterium]|nr:glycosyltransferase [Bacteroidales bacterium]